MNTPDKKELIDYFTGQLPAADKDRVETFIIHTDDVAFVQQCMEESWRQTDLQAGGQHTTPEQLHTAWQLFSNHTGIAARRQLLPRISRWTAIAAAACIAGILAVWAVRVLQTPPQAPVEQWTQITAAPQSLKKVQLPDGSNITLFPGTTVQYSNTYNQQERHIRLSGRAYFDIAAQPDKPFSVQTGSYTTQVLGTRFEVNEQHNVSQLQVFLESGKVRVMHQQQALATLAPSEVLEVAMGNGTFRKRTAGAHTLAWLHGELSYDQAPLRTVCDDLEAWYGIHIHINSERLAHRHFTGNFAGMSLQDVMQILSATVGCHYKLTQQDMTIY